MEDGLKNEAIVERTEIFVKLCLKTQFLTRPGWNLGHISLEFLALTQDRSSRCWASFGRSVY